MPGESGAASSVLAMYNDNDDKNNNDNNDHIDNCNDSNNSNHSKRNGAGPTKRHTRLVYKFGADVVIQVLFYRLLFLIRQSIIIRMECN